MTYGAEAGNLKRLPAVQQGEGMDTKRTYIRTENRRYYMIEGVRKVYRAYDDVRNAARLLADMKQSAVNIMYKPAKDVRNIEWLLCAIIRPMRLLHKDVEMNRDSFIREESTDGIAGKQS